MGKYDTYFTAVSDTLICKQCEWTTKKKEDGTTALVRYHLKSKHPKSFEEFCASEKLKKLEMEKNLRRAKQGLKRYFDSDDEAKDITFKVPRLQDGTPQIMQALKEWDIDGEKTLKVTRAIMQFICTAALPLSVVENQGFTNLLAIIAPRFRLRSRTHFTRIALPELYDEYAAKVKSMLSEASHISFTSDVWSSSDNVHSILSLTAHFIDKDWRPKFVVMAASPLKERHTAENMQSKIAKALSAFDIPDEKIHVFVRDSASSMIRMTNLLNVKSWDCFAHKLQLAVKKGLRMMAGIDDGTDSLLGRVSKIVRKMKKSGVDHKEFNDCQKLYSLPERTLVKGIEVRWNSIHDMLTRILEVRRPLELFILDHENYPQLDATDWELIKKNRGTAKAVGRCNECSSEPFLLTDFNRHTSLQSNPSQAGTGKRERRDATNL